MSDDEVNRSDQAPARPAWARPTMIDHSDQVLPELSRPAGDDPADEPTAFVSLIHPVDQAGSAQPGPSDPAGSGVAEAGGSGSAHATGSGPADEARRWVGRARPVPPVPPGADPWADADYPGYPADQAYLTDPVPAAEPGYPLGSGYAPGSAHPVRTGGLRVPPGRLEVVSPPLPSRRRSGRRGMLFVAGVLAACLAGGATLVMLGSAAIKSALADTEDAGGPAPTAPAKPRRTTPPAPRKPTGGAVGLNTPVRDGKFEFVVTSVSCGHDSVGNSLVHTEAKGQFCVVSLSVRNIGTESQTFTDLFQVAQDRAGNEYRADVTAGLIANSGAKALWTVIEPGDRVSGKIVYDLPDDETLATLELHDAILSGGATVNVPG
ncbi:MAG TPA: DUF4352 domain-containing protein [Micromonosporaceae bacterium]